MSPAQLKVVITCTFFLLIFLFGYWLNRKGKPYNTLLITLHKLIALGAAVYLIITLVKLSRVSPFSPLQISAIVLTAVCFSGTAATGVLLSFKKDWPVLVHVLHHVTPYLTLISTAALLYLLI
jgi:hypothetical protein